MLRDIHRTWVQDQLIAARHRLKTYLVHACPERLRHTELLLQQYALDSVAHAVDAAMAADLPINARGDGTSAITVGSAGVSRLDDVSGGGPFSSSSSSSPPQHGVGGVRAASGGGGGLRYAPSSEDDDDDDAADSASPPLWRQRQDTTGVSATNDFSPYNTVSSRGAVADNEATKALAFRVGLFLELQTSRMMTDLVSHFRIAEPAQTDPRDATYDDGNRPAGARSVNATGGASELVADRDPDGMTSLRSIFSPAVPPSTTAALHPQYQLAQRALQRSAAGAEPGYSGMRSAPFATPRAAQRTSAAAQAGWAQDHTPYVRGATKPTGFDRKDALCPVCGVEALNPVELQRHLQWQHGRFPDHAT